MSLSNTTTEHNIATICPLTASCVLANQLFIAIANGHFEQVCFILESGYDPTIPVAIYGNGSLPAVILAAGTGQLHILQKLHEFSFDSTKWYQDPGECFSSHKLSLRSALDAALLINSHECALWLLEQGITLCDDISKDTLTYEATPLNTSMSVMLAAKVHGMIEIFEIICQKYPLLFKPYFAQAKTAEMFLISLKGLGDYRSLSILLENNVFEKIGYAPPLNRFNVSILMDLIHNKHYALAQQYCAINVTSDNLTDESRTQLLSASLNALTKNQDSAELTHQISLVKKLINLNCLVAILNQFNIEQDLIVALKEKHLDLNQDVLSKISRETALILLNNLILVSKCEESTIEFITNWEHLGKPDVESPYRHLQVSAILGLSLLNRALLLKDDSMLTHYVEGNFGLTLSDIDNYFTVNPQNPNFSYLLDNENAHMSATTKTIVHLWCGSLPNDCFYNTWMIVLNTLANELRTTLSTHKVFVYNLMIKSSILGCCTKSLDIILNSFKQFDTEYASYIADLIIDEKTLKSVSKIYNKQQFSDLILYFFEMNIQFNANCFEEIIRRCNSTIVERFISEIGDDIPHSSPDMLLIAAISSFDHSVIKIIHNLLKQRDCLPQNNSFINQSSQIFIDKFIVSDIDTTLLQYLVSEFFPEFPKLKVQLEKNIFEASDANIMPDTVGVKCDIYTILCRVIKSTCDIMVIDYFCSLFSSIYAKSNTVRNNWVFLPVYMQSTDSLYPRENKSLQYKEHLLSLMFVYFNSNPFHSFEHYISFATQMFSFLTSCSRVNDVELAKEFISCMPDNLIQSQPLQDGLSKLILQEVFRGATDGIRSLLYDYCTTLLSPYERRSVPDEAHTNKAALQLYNLFFKGKKIIPPGGFLLFSETPVKDLNLLHSKLKKDDYPRFTLQKHFFPLAHIWFLLKYDFPRNHPDFKDTPIGKYITLIGSQNLEIRKALVFDVFVLWITALRPEDKKISSATYSHYFLNVFDDAPEILYQLALTCFENKHHDYLDLTLRHCLLNAKKFPAYSTDKSNNKSSNRSLIKAFFDNRSKDNFHYLWALSCLGKYDLFNDNEFSDLMLELIDQGIINEDLKRLALNQRIMTTSIRHKKHKYENPIAYALAKRQLDIAIFLIEHVNHMETIHAQLILTPIIERVIIANSTKVTLYLLQSNLELSSYNIHGIINNLKWKDDECILSTLIENYSKDIQSIQKSNVIFTLLQFAISNCTEVTLKNILAIQLALKNLHESQVSQLLALLEKSKHSDDIKVYLKNQLSINKASLDKNLMLSNLISDFEKRMNCMRNDLTEVNNALGVVTQYHSRLEQFHERVEKFLSMVQESNIAEAFKKTVLKAHNKTKSIQDYELDCSIEDITKMITRVDGMLANIKGELSNDRLSFDEIKAKYGAILEETEGESQALKSKMPTVYDVEAKQSLLENKWQEFKALYLQFNIHKQAQAYKAENWQDDTRHSDTSEGDNSEIAPPLAPVATHQPLPTVILTTPLADLTPLVRGSNDDASFTRHLKKKANKQSEKRSLESLIAMQSRGETILAANQRLAPLINLIVNQERGLTFSRDYLAACALSDRGPMLECVRRNILYHALIVADNLQKLCHEINQFVEPQQANHLRNIINHIYYDFVYAGDSQLLNALSNFLLNAIIAPLQNFDINRDDYGLIPLELSNIEFYTTCLPRLQLDPSPDGCDLYQQFLQEQEFLAAMTKIINASPQSPTTDNHTIHSVYTSMAIMGEILSSIKVPRSYSEKLLSHLQTQNKDLFQQNQAHRHNFARSFLCEMINADIDTLDILMDPNKRKLSDLATLMIEMRNSLAHSDNRSMQDALTVKELYKYFIDNNIISDLANYYREQFVNFNPIATPSIH